MRLLCKGAVASQFPFILFCFLTYELLRPKLLLGCPWMYLDASPDDQSSGLPEMQDYELNKSSPFTIKCTRNFIVATQS